MPCAVQDAPLFRDLLSEFDISDSSSCSSSYSNIDLELGQLEPKVSFLSEQPEIGRRASTFTEGGLEFDSVVNLFAQEWAFAQGPAPNACIGDLSDEKLLRLQPVIAVGVHAVSPPERGKLRVGSLGLSWISSDGQIKRGAYVLNLKDEAYDEQLEGPLCVFAADVFLHAYLVAN